VPDVSTYLLGVPPKLVGQSREAEASPVWLGRPARPSGAAGLLAQESDPALAPGAAKARVDPRQWPTMGAGSDPGADRGLAP
jgi:hypothetical protein